MIIKKLLLTSSLFVGLTFTGRGQLITKLDKSKISFVSLDNKIPSLMKAANVQGLAISVFNNNEPVYKKTFGYKSIDTNRGYYPGCPFQCAFC